MQSTQRIGGSQVAAIFCVHPWLSAYELWAILTGRENPPDLSGDEAVYWGTRLEEIVIDEYQKRTGRVVTRENRQVQHPAFPFMAGEVDGWITDPERPERETGVLDAKTTNAFAGHEWKDGAPAYYQIQIQHYLACSGKSWGSVGVLIGGQKFRWCDIPRHEKFIRTLEQRCQEWWETHVVQDVPPPVDGSESTRRALAALYPEDDGGEVLLSHSICETAEQLALLEEQKGQIESEIQEAKNRIIEEIGPATRGILPDGSGWFTYKLTHRKACSVKESSFRVLRRGGSKE